MSSLPWFALTLNGYLHAVSTVQSEADAQRFLISMERQGYAVTRLTPNEARARFAPLSSGVAKPRLTQAIGIPELERTPEISIFPEIQP